MRVLVLVDGEHYPPVVRAAIDALPARLAGAGPAGGVSVIAAALLGGTEKLRDGLPDLGLPLITGTDADDALLTAIVRHRPDVVFDLSDEPVVDDRSRLRLAARTLAAGIPYLGADFRFDPPDRPVVATKPSIAVIGTGKRTGKTAVSAQLARLLVEQGRPPVIVAMGRGGPPDPELIDPTATDLSVESLLALADSGRHAASDHLEDALMARVATVGTRRCGGGLAGMPVDSTFAAGVALANARPEPFLVFEGSGRAIPPVHADATLCVVPAHADPELVVGYLGAYRLLLSDAVVITMDEASIARPLAGDEVVESSQASDQLERSIRGLVPTVRLVRTVFRPTPLAPLEGRHVAFATTAPQSASQLLKEHLETEHLCTVVGVSHHLANRPQLRADLEAMGDVDTVLVELKAAAIDMAARYAIERGMEVVFCDNRVISTGGDGSFDELAGELADLAVGRFDGGASPAAPEQDRS